MRSPTSDFRTVCHQQCRFVTDQLVVRGLPFRGSSTLLQYRLSQIDQTMHRRLRKLDVYDRHRVISWTGLKRGRLIAIFC